MEPVRNETERLIQDLAASSRRYRRVRRGNNLLFLNWQHGWRSVGPQIAGGAHQLCRSHTLRACCCPCHQSGCIGARLLRARRSVPPLCPLRRRHSLSYIRGRTLTLTVVLTEQGTSVVASELAPSRETLGGSLRLRLRLRLPARGVTVTARHNARGITTAGALRVIRGGRATVGGTAQLVSCGRTRPEPPTGATVIACAESTPHATTNNHSRAPRPSRTFPTNERASPKD